MTPEQVHSTINSAHTYRREPLGRDDWKTPAEFDADGFGDCEDFAIAYFFAVGGRTRGARLAWCLAPESHMVCLINDSSDPLVLDVLADAPYRLSEKPELQVIIQFDEIRGLALGRWRVLNIDPWLRVLERMGA